MKTTSIWLKNALKQLHELVHTERRIGVEILELLWEIERRKSYSELGYDGLYTFCIRELKFTEAQAYHRIQAMRAMKMNSKAVGHAIESRIKSGAMSVSTVAQVQADTAPSPQKLRASDIEIGSPEFATVQEYLKRFGY